MGQKKFFSISLLVTTPLLFSCLGVRNKENKESFDYGDFVNSQLSWEELFSPAKPLYFVYIYSLTCGHCQNIKDEILTWGKEREDIFYLIEYEKGIPITRNTSETIGAYVYSDVKILGTPTLLEIMDKRLSLNLGGERDILTFIDFTKSG